MRAAYGCRSCESVFPVPVGGGLPSACPRCRKEGDLIAIDLDALRRGRAADDQRPCERGEPCDRLSGVDCPGGRGC